MNTKVRDHMTAQVLTVPPELTVRELQELLLSREISGAPVAGPDGEPIGVVSLTDIAGAAGESSAVMRDRGQPDWYVHGWEDALNPDDLGRLHIEDEGLTVADIMTDTLYQIDADARMVDAARMMHAAHVHRLLVTEGGKTVGILSTFDVLEAVALED